MSDEIRNWSRVQRFTPRDFFEPGDAAALANKVKEVKDRGGKIRARGNLHSFSEIVVTDDTLVSLSGLGGLIDVDTEAARARFRAGTSIFDLSRALDARGLAVPNLGDIDVQTIAGAAATGTHGTGLHWGNVSAQIVAAQVVTADGEILEVDESDMQTLKALRVSLGAIGILTEVTLQCVPSFRLDRLDTPAPLAETLDQADALSAEFDHFEFYVLPYSDVALQKRIDRSDAPAEPMSRPRQFLNDVVIENLAFGAAVKVGKTFPKTIPPIARKVTSMFSPERRLDKSFEAFSTVRIVRFHEMEYAIPREHLREAVTDVMQLIEGEKLPINFPIEVRVGQADHDSFLSTAAGRETCYISVHTAKGMQWKRYFRGVEEIMNGYEGRPHWGKYHFQTAETLSTRYPEWDAFQEVRRRLDPTGVFSNDYIERVLGPA